MSNLKIKVDSKNIDKLSNYFTNEVDHLSRVNIENVVLNAYDIIEGLNDYLSRGAQKGQVFSLVTDAENTIKRFEFTIESTATNWYFVGIKKVPIKGYKNIIKFKDFEGLASKIGTKILKDMIKITK